MSVRLRQQKRWARNGFIRGLQQAYRTEHFWINAVAWVLIGLVVAAWLGVCLYRASIGY